MGEEVFAESELEQIAIIGMAGRFPGSRSIGEFWQNLHDGVESVVDLNGNVPGDSRVPEEWLSRPDFVRRGTILPDVEKFDASFFGYSPRDAFFMDPQQRLFLEAAWESLEDAGYVPGSGDNTVAVFAGSSPNEYGRLIAESVDPTDAAGRMSLMINNDNDFLATRVSYKLDLTGPSMTVQTGCSTSLVTVHLACQHLLTYQCSLALAGGSSVNINRSQGYFYQEGTIVSPDGRCRAFDSRANGTVVGQGVGVVVLKRLSEAVADRDHIYAVIRGSAVNNDGAMKAGYTAPSVMGQSLVIRQAQALSEVTADSVSYVEAHGTGTKLGDPVELEALTRAFRKDTEKKQFCAIGSVKTNIGHANAAAGIAGLIKAALMLTHRKIPASLHFREPNALIDLVNSPFYVASELTEWRSNGSPRRAGVSSFGLGGTNAHVVLEESPEREDSRTQRDQSLIVLSARSSPALHAVEARMVSLLKNSSSLSLPDVAFTLQVGRKPFGHRSALVARDRAEAAKRIEDRDPGYYQRRSEAGAISSVSFMFTGQGSQFAGMARGLYESEGVFRYHVDECLRLLPDAQRAYLTSIWFPERDCDSSSPDEGINATENVQVMLFILEYALARLWISWGIQPESMVGHSLGEYTAACISGVFTLPSALDVVSARGRLMQRAPEGAMLAVFMAERDLAGLIDDKLSLAVVNSPANCVVSGSHERVNRLVHQLDEMKQGYRRLRTSHAFHSALMEPVLDDFRRVLQRVTLEPPGIPFVSNTTGQWISDEEATDREYWVQHVRRSVRFSESINTLLEDESRVFLEIGPGSTLCALAMQQSAAAGCDRFFSSLPGQRGRLSDQDHLLATLGKLWVCGIEPDWRGFHDGERLSRLPLPTYPFEGKSFWPSTTPWRRTPTDGTAPENVGRTDSLAEPAAPDTAASSPGDARQEGSISERLASLWQAVLHLEHIQPDDDFFELGGDSLLGANLMSVVNRNFETNLPIETIFRSSSVADMAQVIADQNGDSSQGEPDLQDSLSKLGFDQLRKGT